MNGQGRKYLELLDGVGGHHTALLRYGGCCGCRGRHLLASSRLRLDALPAARQLHAHAGLVAELAVSRIALHSLHELRLHLRRVASRVPVAHALVVAVRVLGIGWAQSARHQLSQ